jgi:hypothetical protein
LLNAVYQEAFGTIRVRVSDMLIALHVWKMNGSQDG